MNIDDKNKMSLDLVKDDSNNLQNKKKKITRTKLLQSANKKYSSNFNGVSINSKQPGSKRAKHLNGISRGYLDSGVISNTMRLYTKSSGSDSSNPLQYSFKKNRSKKLGNYQRKALNRLTGTGNKKKLRDLAMMFSDDDGDVEDDENNDNFEDFFKENSREQEDDIDIMNIDDDDNSIEPQTNASTESYDHMTDNQNLFVTSNKNGIEKENNFTQQQQQIPLPTLASLQYNKISNENNNNNNNNNKLIPSYSNETGLNTNIMTIDNDTNSNSNNNNNENGIPLAESAKMKRNISNPKGMMSNDGEDDYDDDEFGYDGDEDFDGDNSNGNSRKDIQRRKQLESDFDDQFLMPPGSHSIDNLITDTSNRYGDLKNDSFKKLSESSDLNIGLAVGKRRRRSSNYQDIVNKNGIFSSASSTTTITIHPETKKVKLTSNTPEDIEAVIEYEEHFADSLDASSTTTTTASTKKLKRKHLKPPKIVLDPNYSKSLTIKDIRDLVIYSLDKNEKNRPVWCKVENRMNIEKVIVLQIPGVQPKDLRYKGTALKSFEELLNDKNKILKTSETFFDNDNTLTLSSKAPGNASFVFSAYSAFTNVPLTKQKQANLMKKLSKKTATLKDMLLDLDDMIELQYPIHPAIAGNSSELAARINDLNMQLPENNFWVQTYAKNDFKNYIPIAYALDCEMCLTQNGHELTRISVVNFDGVLIYDKLVRPKNEIIDYLTRFSGITEEMMQNADHSLEQVQEDLLNLFDSRDILIGHSLQSDFKVIKIRHPNIIDTAHIYEHVKGPPFKPALKKLSSVFLGKEIQNDDIAGHDPSIDARTCVELVTLKLIKGLQIGLNLNSETIFKKLEDSSNVRSLIFNKFGPDESFADLNKESNLKCISFKDDSDIIEKILKNLDDCSLFVGKLNSLESARYFTNKSTGSAGSQVDTGNDHNYLDSQTVDSLKEEQAVKNLNSILKKLTDNISKNTMIVLFSGSGDSRLYKKITAETNAIHIPEKRRLETLRRRDELKQAVEQARDSIVTIYIKK